MHDRPLDQLTAHLTARPDRGDGSDLLHRLAATGLDLGGCRTPADLARRCQQEDASGWADGVLGSLVRLADDGDELASLTALVALRPALQQLARRLGGAGAPSTEAEADVLSAAWLALRSGAGRPDDGGGVGRRVVRSAWNRLRTQQRRSRGHTTRLPDRFDVAVEEADPARQLSTLLDDARRLGTLTRRQAAVIEATRVHGQPLQELAAAAGIDFDRLRMERARAEHRLRHLLTANQYGVEDRR